MSPPNEIVDKTEKPRAVRCQSCRVRMPQSFNEECAKTALKGSEKAPTLQWRERGLTTITIAGTDESLRKRGIGCRFPLSLRQIPSRQLRIKRITSTSTLAPRLRSHFTSPSCTWMRIPGAPSPYFRADWPLPGMNKPCLHLTSGRLRGPCGEAKAGENFPDCIR